MPLVCRAHDMSPGRNEGDSGKAVTRAHTDCSAPRRGLRPLSQFPRRDHHAALGERWRFARFRDDCVSLGDYRRSLIYYRYVNTIDDYLHERMKKVRSRQLARWLIIGGAMAARYADAYRPAAQMSAQDRCCRYVARPTPCEQALAARARQQRQALAAYEHFILFYLFILNARC